MHMKAFNDRLPCTVNLRLAVAMLSICQEMVEPTCTGPTRECSFKGLVAPMRRVLGGAIMSSRPVSARGREMCGPYVMSAIVVMPSPVRLPHDLTLVRAHYAMTVWAVRRVLLLPVLMYESVQS
jgi:hypothetical protein